MVGFEKALGAVKVIKDQIQYRSQSLLNLARGYFITHSVLHFKMFDYQPAIRLKYSHKKSSMIQQIESISLVVQFEWSIK